MWLAVAGRPAVAPAVTGDPLRRTLVWDGDCSFCERWASRIRSPRTGRPETVAWQRLGSDALARVGLTEAEVTTAAYWIDAEGRPFRGHRAVAKALIDAGGGRAWWGRAIELPGMSSVAGALYRFVAAHRRWTGFGAPACHVGGPVHRTDPPDP